MNKVMFSKYFSLKNIVIKYILLLIPFIIYGIYKNGILLYQKNIIDFFGIFKVIYLILISLGINVIGDIVLKKKINWRLDIITAFIVPILMPYNINYLVFSIGYLVGIIVSELLSKLLYINKDALIVSIILILVMIMQGLNFLNPLEASNIYSFDTFDLLWGRTYGGMASTWIIYAYVFILLASILNDYKFAIPITTILTYFLVSFLLIGFSYKTYTNSFVIVSIILLNFDSRYSPIIIWQEIIYGLILGILLTIVVVYLKSPIWIFMCQFVVSLLYQIIAKYSRVCYNMNDFLEKKTNK